MSEQKFSKQTLLDAVEAYEQMEKRARRAEDALRATFARLALVEYRPIPNLQDIWRWGAQDCREDIYELQSEPLQRLLDILQIKSKDIEVKRKRWCQQDDYIVNIFERIIDKILSEDCLP